MRDPRIGSLASTCPATRKLRPDHRLCHGPQVKLIAFGREWRVGEPCAHLINLTTRRPRPLGHTGCGVGAKRARLTHAIAQQAGWMPSSQHSVYRGYVWPHGNVRKPRRDKSAFSSKAAKQQLCFHGSANYVITFSPCMLCSCQSTVPTDHPSAFSSSSRKCAGAAWEAIQMRNDI